MLRISILTSSCCGLTALALTACGTSPAQPEPANAAASVPLPLAATGSTSSVSGGTLGAAFSTKYARFTPLPFAQIPGWRDETLGEGMPALQQSCSALRSKAVWKDLCPQVSQIASSNSAGLREFFEKNFYAYSVIDTEQTTDKGVITGYFEPQLEGSRQRSVRFAYPVLGVPADLLFLDARTVRNGQSVWLRQDNRLLLVAPDRSAGAQLYQIQLGNVSANIRDKRYRVRVEQANGRLSVLPYWSRQQIERRQPDAQVLAWVDNAFALYSMQIQGSGKIRLAESGEIVRVAYGEQNGYPFLPQASRKDSIDVSTAVKTRGISAGPSSPSTSANASATPASGGDDEVQRIIAALSGKKGANTRPAAQRPAAVANASANVQNGPPATAVPAPNKPTSGNSEVNAMIAALKGGKSSAPSSGNAGVAPSVDSAPAPVVSAPTERAGTSGIPDPSYVFFRRIPDGPQGPLGALGVPLTAGRSIAVDPRTTPLGYPVYSATNHASGGDINRLVFAQDTGGAIRGTVRADYFWGSGAQAGRQASSMKAPLRMWLLLPKLLNVSALSNVRTRSAGGVPALSECVIEDPDNCVDD